jgi:hypothetical protein
MREPNQGPTARSISRTAPMNSKSVARLYIVDEALVENIAKKIDDPALAAMLATLAVAVF